MSVRRSLTLAVRDQLRATVLNGGLALEVDECEVMADGKPPPGCGIKFAAVHQGPRRNRLLTGDESEFGCMVTLSWKTSAPFDRIGTAEIEVADGLDDFADSVWHCIFARQWGVDPTGVMNKADDYLLSAALPGSSYYQWVEALYPQDMGLPTPVREEWFNATRTGHQTRGSQYAETMQFCGFSVAITFGGAKRIQRLGDAGA